MTPCSPAGRENGPPRPFFPPQKSKVDEFSWRLTFGSGSQKNFVGKSGDLGIATSRDTSRRDDRAAAVTSQRVGTLVSRHGEGPYLFHHAQTQIRCVDPRGAPGRVDLDPGFARAALSRRRCTRRECGRLAGLNPWRCFRAREPQRTERLAWGCRGASVRRHTPAEAPRRGGERGEIWGGEAAAEARQRRGGHARR